MTSYIFETLRLSCGVTNGSIVLISGDFPQKGVTSREWIYTTRVSTVIEKMPYLINVRIVFPEGGLSKKHSDQNLYSLNDNICVKISRSLEDPRGLFY